MKKKKKLSSFLHTAALNKFLLKLSLSVCGAYKVLFGIDNPAPLT